MEEAFDGFFDKHHLKLQQYLQLLQYEISFQQVGLFSSEKSPQLQTSRFYPIIHSWKNKSEQV